MNKNSFNNWFNRSSMESEREENREDISDHFAKVKIFEFMPQPPIKLANISTLLSIRDSLTDSLFCFSYLECLSFRR